MGADGAPALPGLSDAEIDTQIAARIEARKARTGRNRTASVTHWWRQA